MGCMSLRNNNNTSRMLLFVWFVSLLLVLLTTSSNTMAFMDRALIVLTSPSSSSSSSCCSSSLASVLQQKKKISLSSLSRTTSVSIPITFHRQIISPSSRRASSSSSSCSILNLHPIHSGMESARTEIQRQRHQRLMVVSGPPHSRSIATLRRRFFKLFDTRDPPDSTTKITTKTTIADEQEQSNANKDDDKEEVDPGIVEGTDLRIVKYPHPSLRAPNVEVNDDEMKDGSISKLAKEMLLVMYAAKGVGLAAPQVGVNKRLMVYNESGDKKKWLDEMIMINPIIVSKSKGKDIDNEGCLSFPGMNGNVERSKWIKVEAMNLKGKKIKKKFDGWEARIFQHEYDHLDGIVYIDHLNDDDRKEVQPVLNNLIQQFGSNDIAL